MLLFFEVIFNKTYKAQKTKNAVHKWNGI